jgi:alkanesulfonate monooxygenase SsuD/methylene tetrahydromethanopterin reductase-like flavin-dependent oxidoreductase (luciferase family)
LLVRNGRDSSSIRILAAISPRLAATQDRAEEIAGQLSQLIDLEVGLGRLELRMGNIQLRDLDPDQRIPADRLPPAEEIEGGQGLYTTFRTLALDQGLSLRQLIDVESAAYGLWSPVGSPESVAEEMIDWCKDGACDGFNVHPAYLPEGADLFFNSVVPILRERGMFRDEYSGSQLRSHLGLPRPKMVFDEVSSDTGQLT